MKRSSERVLVAASAGVIGFGIAIMLGAGAATRSAEPEATSYAIGYDLGETTLARLMADGVEFDSTSLTQGFDDAMLGRDAAIEFPERRASLAVLQRQVAERLAEAQMIEDPVFAAVANQNKAEAQTFMEAFAEHGSTQQLDGGVAYQIDATGDGPSPSAGDTVRVSFRVRLRDGTLVGDERDFIVPIDGMIKGAQIAISAMSVGDRWIVVIPPEHAFGLGGRAPDIGPNEVIIADVELLGIEP